MRYARRKVLSVPFVVLIAVLATLAAIGSLLFMPAAHEESQSVEVAYDIHGNESYHGWVNSVYECLTQDSDAYETQMSDGSPDWYACRPWPKQELVLQLPYHD